MIGKVAILVPANLWFCPFVNIYTELLDKWAVHYDIIYWDKNGEQESIGISYKGNSGKSAISKFIGYYKFSRFIKAKLTKQNYAKVIVFSSQIGIFCSNYLKKYYKGNYIFDFRDLSIEQSYVFSKPFHKLLANSFANVISSPGFKRCLPSEYNYYLSHNFVESEVRKSLNPINPSLPKSPIRILTIGGIRDFESNASLMDVIANNGNYELSFIGKGPAAHDLEIYANKNEYRNVLFKGFYNKEDEPDYVKSSTFLNIFYPDLLSHQTALSNRFYNSLIYRKPMIVTKGQVQGDYCEKYDLGVAISDINSLQSEIETWLSEVNVDDYENRCIRLLNKFISDYDKFMAMLNSFCKL